MYNNAGYLYSVWPLKKLTLIPKYSIGITGNARYNANARALILSFSLSLSYSNSRTVGQLTNFHHISYIFPQSFFSLWHINRGFVPQFALVVGHVGLVHVKMCATYNRPELCVPTQWNSWRERISSIKRCSLAPLRKTKWKSIHSLPVFISLPLSKHDWEWVLKIRVMVKIYFISVICWTLFLSLFRAFVFLHMNVPCSAKRMCAHNAHYLLVVLCMRNFNPNVCSC